MIDRIQREWTPDPQSPEEAAAFEERVLERIGEHRISGWWAVPVLAAAAVAIAMLWPSAPDPGAPERPEARVLEPIRADFDAREGGVVRGEDGVRLAFPPRSIRTPDGELVDGQVDVAWELVADPDAVAEGPVDLRTRADERSVPLQSFGMVHVELEHAGEPVELDGVAQLSFPMVEDHGFAEGQAVGLYHYDEHAEHWTREGEGRNEGGRFVAEVEHSSWWNADEPIWNTGCFAGTLEPPEGQAVDAIVRVVGTKYLTRESGIPDEQGRFCVEGMPDAPARIIGIQRSADRCFRWESTEMSASAAGTSCAAPSACTPVALRPVDVDCPPPRARDEGRLILRGPSGVEGDRSRLPPLGYIDDDPMEAELSAAGYVDEDRKPHPKPAPAPVPAPAPIPAPPASATWSVSGGASTVLLEARSQRYPPGPVPSGTYGVLANFGNGLVRAGELTLADGETAEVACSSLMVRCTAQVSSPVR